MEYAQENDKTNYNADNIEDTIFSSHVIGDQTFNVNVKEDELNILYDFCHVIPYYDHENGLHLRFQQKNSNKIRYVPLNMSVVNGMLMGKWDKLNNEEFKKLTNEQYDEFMNYFVTCKTAVVDKLIRQTLAKGYDLPSTVQSFCIPFLIQRRDGIVQFKSGSGKTHSFLFGLLWGIDPNNNKLQYIFVTSSHEVAKQIYEQAIFLMPSETKISLCIGQGGTQNPMATGGFKGSVGTSIFNSKPKSIKEKMDEVKNAQILVGTMGKLHEYFFNPRCKCIDPRFLKAFCVDEFDNIVASNVSSKSPSTGEQMQDMIKELPETTQRVFFSATVSESAITIAHKYFRSDKNNNPFIVLLNSNDHTLDGIKQYYVEVENYYVKQDVLLDLLKQCRIDQGIIFTNRIDTANEIKNLLDDQKIPIPNAVFHGSLAFDARDKIQKDFRAGIYRILISTNVTARGFDVQGINLVINFDMPDDYQTYIHRIGRSGRYGRKGVAISLVLIDHKKKINELLKVEAINECSVNNKITVLPDNLSNLL